MKVFGVDVEAGQKYHILLFRAPRATTAQIEYNLRCLGFKQDGDMWEAPTAKVAAKNEKARNEATY